MRILAWIWVGAIAINVVSEPFMYGRPREPYGAQTWIASILGAAMAVPLIGKILGWW